MDQDAKCIARDEAFTASIEARLSNTGIYRDSRGKERNCGMARPFIDDTSLAELARNIHARTQPSVRSNGTGIDMGSVLSRRQDCLGPPHNSQPQELGKQVP